MSTSAAVADAGLLLFEPDTHTYSISGRRVPSVTQVLQAAGLMTWLDRIPPDKLAAGQARGTRVHKGVERILLGKFDWGGEADEYESAGELGYLNAVLRWLDESKFKVNRKRVEHRFYNRKHAYAGMLDVEGETGGGEQATVDFKSGGFEASARLQLAAYQFRDPRDGKAAFGRRIVLQLKRDGTYRATPLPLSENRHDFDVFLGALRVAVFKERHRMRTYGSFVLGEKEK